VGHGAAGDHELAVLGEGHDREGHGVPGCSFHGGDCSPGSIALPRRGSIE
jgi:hypothetical protein